MGIAVGGAHWPFRWGCHVGTDLLAGARGGAAARREHLESQPRMVLEALEPERPLRGERRTELGLPAFRGRGEGRSSQRSRGGESGACAAGSREKSGQE